MAQVLQRSARHLMENPTSTVGRKYHGGKQAQTTCVKWIRLPRAYLRRDVLVLLGVNTTAVNKPKLLA